MKLQYVRLENAFYDEQDRLWPAGVQEIPDDVKLPESAEVLKGPQTPEPSAYDSTPLRDVERVNNPVRNLGGETFSEVEGGKKSEPAKKK